MATFLADEDIDGDTALAKAERTKLLAPSHGSGTEAEGVFIHPLDIDGDGADRSALAALPQDRTGFLKTVTGLLYVPAAFGL